MKFGFYTKTTLTVLAAAIILQTTGCRRTTMKINTMPYPETRMDDIKDDYHGTVVADPYRWLEDDNSDETARWVKAQNEVTFDYLSQIPYRDKVKQRITELMDYPKEGLPTKHGDWFYFFYNDGLQNQSVLYRSKTAGGEDAQVFIDPNTLSPDGTVALGSTTFSEDGKNVAYSVSTAGSDWVEIKVMDTETLELMADNIRWVKFSGANWAADSKGFYYSRYDAPAEGTALSGKNEFQKVYYHTLGDDQSKDRVVYMDEGHPLRYFHGWESEDGKYIVISESEVTKSSDSLYSETEALTARVIV
ncbi:MAG: S9 family peptidase, partial [Alistipes sp.]|nr:S9 family peptidase [Alistipes sp.]